MARSNQSSSSFLIIYGLLISMTLVGSLALAATFLIRRSKQNPQIIDTTFTPKPKKSGEVAGVNESGVGNFDVSILEFLPNKITISIFNTSKDPLFLSPIQEISILNNNNEAVSFEVSDEHERLVIVSQEIKNIDLKGDFSNASVVIISPRDKKLKTIPLR